MSKFEPFGPYEVPVRDKLLDETRAKDFWQEVEGEKRATGLPDAIGCYIFAIRAGQGVRPWYVGKTEHCNFRTETFNKYKQVAKILREVKKGTLMLYLVAARTNGGKLRRPSKRKGSGSIGALEKYLIGACLRRNRKLLNEKTTKYLKTIVVPGYMNEPRGKRSDPARALARVLEMPDKNN